MAAVAVVEPPRSEPEIEPSKTAIPINEEKPSETGKDRDGARARDSKKLALIVGGGIAATAAIAAVLWLGFFTAEARILRLASDKLVAPEGSSAYDVYLKEKETGLSASTRDKLQRNLLPKLNAAGDKLLLKRAEGTSFKDSEIMQLTRIYQWAADLNPQDPRMQARSTYAQGMAALVAGKPTVALQFLQASVRYDRSWSPAYNQLGKIYVKLNDHYHAKESYERAVALDPQWVFPQLNLAGVYLHDREWDLAEAAYLKATALDTSLATPWYFLGQVYEARKQTGQAIAAYERAIQLAASRPSSAFKVDALQQRLRTLSRR